MHARDKYEQVWTKKDERVVRMVFDSRFELSRAEKFWTKILNMNKDEQDLR